MPLAHDALAAANSRVLALTWRGVWLALLMAALSALSLVFSGYHRAFPWTGSFTGIIVLLTGVQLRLAHGQLTRLHSQRAFRWVKPLAFALVTAGTLILIRGLWAGAHLLAA